MARSRGGRGRGRGGRRGAIGVGNRDSDDNMDDPGQAAIQNSSSPNVYPGSQSVDPNDLCGTCNGITRLDAIGCDRCNRWFHPSSMCMGISEVLIAGIQTDGGGSVLFACTECKTENSKGGNVNNSAFKQLMQTVKTLCETVQALSAQVATLKSEPCRSSGPRPNGDPQPPSTVPPVKGSSDESKLRILIREEAREMAEREKRKASIIIRGVNAQSVASFRPVFNGISSFLIGSEVALSDIVCISKEKKLFRAKVNDDDARKQLLDNARNLGNSSFSDIFISKDLTYQQRGELRARRDQRNKRSNEGNSSGENRPVGASNGSAAAATIVAPPPANLAPPAPPVVRANSASSDGGPEQSGPSNTNAVFDNSLPDDLSNLNG